MWDFHYVRFNFSPKEKLKISTYKVYDSFL